MAEVGCLRDVSVQNLEVNGTTKFTGGLCYTDKISLLNDAGGAGGAIRGPLTLGDSGTHFIVPALTGGAQLIVLPAVSAANVGFTVRFTMLATSGQVFSVDTAATADKIITAEPDGDGTVTITANANGFNFTTTAAVGASFKITMISATASTAFHVTDVTSGVAGGTGEHVAE
jgi:hypothetical protein